MPFTDLELEDEAKQKPAAIVADDGSLYVFAMTGSLWWRRRAVDGAWTDWERFEHTQMSYEGSDDRFTVGVGIYRRSDGRLEVVSGGQRWNVDTFSDMIVTKAQSSSGSLEWDPWESVPGDVIALGPAILTRRNGDAEVYFADNSYPGPRVVRVRQNNGEWQDPEKLFLPGEEEPQGLIEIIVKIVDGFFTWLKSVFVPDSNSSDSATIAAAPAAVSLHDDGVLLCLTMSNGELLIRRMSPSGDWSDWESSGKLPGDVSHTAAVCLLQRGDGGISMYAAADGVLWERQRSASGDWEDWISQSAPTPLRGVQPAATIDSFGAQWVYVADEPNSHLWRWYRPGPENTSPPFWEELEGVGGGNDEVQDLIVVPYGDKVHAIVRCLDTFRHETKLVHIEAQRFRPFNRSWSGRFLDASGGKLLMHTHTDGKWRLGTVTRHGATRTLAFEEVSEPPEAPPLADGRACWQGSFSDDHSDQLLTFSTERNVWLLGDLTRNDAGSVTHTWVDVTTAQFAVLGHTPDPFNPAGRHIWVGRFAGNVNDQLLAFSSGDNRWHLGAVRMPPAAPYGIGIADQRPHIGWTDLGQNAFPDGTLPFELSFVGRFTGGTASELLFYSPTGLRFWIGTVIRYPGGTFFEWSVPYDVGGFGNIASKPMWAGNFRGIGISDILFYSQAEHHWWLGSMIEYINGVPRFRGEFLWSRASAEAFDFTHGSVRIGEWGGPRVQTQLLLHNANTGRWVLGSIAGPEGTQIAWHSFDGTTGGGIASIPRWLANFTGNGFTSGLHYVPDSDKWKLQEVQGDPITWSLVTTVFDATGVIEALLEA